MLDGWPGVASASARFRRFVVVGAMSAAAATLRNTSAFSTASPSIRSRSVRKYRASPSLPSERVPAVGGDWVTGLAGGPPLGRPPKALQPVAAITSSNAVCLTISHRHEVLVGRASQRQAHLEVRA